MKFVKNNKEFGDSNAENAEEAQRNPNTDLDGGCRVHPMGGQARSRLGLGTLSGACDRKTLQRRQLVV